MTDGLAGTAERATNPITARVAMEIISHESIVLEAYKDSRRIWTWGIGVTDASGHNVERYIDKPQTIEHCLDIYIWLLQTKYAPDVLRTFRDHPLTEAQFAAALSFHYNTGAITRASWVNAFKSGNMVSAPAAFMEYCHPPEVIGRRTKEANLLFDGIWSNDGKATILPVLKPSYNPDFRHPSHVDITAALATVLGS